MVKGSRDDHATLRVPQENCFNYTSKSTKEEFVEVKLPNYTDEKWDSFMVKPDQVYFDHANPDVYNIIEQLNRDTKILVSTKKKVSNSGDRIIVADSNRYFDPLELIVLFKDYN